MHYHSDLSNVLDRQRELEAEAEYQRLANSLIRQNRQARYRKIKQNLRGIVQYFLALVAKFERKTVQTMPQIDLHQDCCTCI